MATKTDDSVSLDGSISFEESEESDCETPVTVHRVLKCQACTPTTLNHDINAEVTTPQIDDELVNRKANTLSEQEAFLPLLTSDWRIHESCGDNTVYMTHTQRRDSLYVAHVLSLETVSCDQLVRLKDVLSTFEKQLTGEYMLNIADMCIDEDNKQLLVIFENCEGGTLHALISRAKQYGEILNEIEIQDWLVQLLVALKHIHAHGIKHLNITCSSLLLKNNGVRLTEPSQLKWLYKKPESAHTVTKSDVIITIETDHKLAYTAPEILLDEHVTDKADVWSVGCVLYEMCARKRLFRAKNSQELHDKVVHAELPKWPKGFPEPFENIWRNMMQVDPETRPSVRELLKQPVLSEHLKEMNLSIVTPLPVSNTSFSPYTLYAPRRTPMPQVVGVEYEIGSDDEDLRLTEEDTRNLLGLDIS